MKISNFNRRVEDLLGQNRQYDLCDFSILVETRDNIFNELSYPYSCKDVIINQYLLCKHTGIDFNDDPTIPTAYKYIVEADLSTNLYNRDKKPFSLGLYVTNRQDNLINNIKYLNELEKIMGLSGISEVHTAETQCSNTQYLNRGRWDSERDRVYILKPSLFWMSNSLNLRLFISFIRLLNNNDIKIVETYNFKKLYYDLQEIYTRGLNSKLKLLKDIENIENSLIKFIYLAHFLKINRTSALTTNVSNDDDEFIRLVNQIPPSIFIKMLKYLPKYQDTSFYKDYTLSCLQQNTILNNKRFDVKQYLQEMSVYKDNVESLSTRATIKFRNLSLYDFLNGFSYFFKKRKPVSLTRYGIISLFRNRQFNSQLLYTLNEMEKVVSNDVNLLNCVKEEKRLICQSNSSINSKIIYVYSIFYEYFIRDEINSKTKEFKWVREKNTSPTKVVLNVEEPTVSENTTIPKKKSTTSRVTKSTVTTMNTYRIVPNTEWIMTTTVV